jgi:hypothetical protein
MGEELIMPYVGSSSIQTSTENLELVETPVDWVNANMKYKQFFFCGESDCTVKINGSDPIFLKGYQPWKVLVDSYNNLDLISSFIIVEADIPFSWYAGY